MQILTQRVRKGQLVSRRLHFFHLPGMLEITEFVGKKDVTCNYYLTEWPAASGPGDGSTHRLPRYNRAPAFFSIFLVPGRGGRAVTRIWGHR
jgi:hypothetical protein